MTTGTKAAALVAMIRNLDGDFTAQCQIAEDVLKQEREDDERLIAAAPAMLAALRATILQHEAGLAKLPTIIADEVREAIAMAIEKPV